MVLSVIGLVVGLIMLVQAADQFVIGAARVAVHLRLSAVLIGAIVIGFGTSLPELLVSGLAAAGGEKEIGFGNIIGSNVANLSLILGVAAVLGTLPITSLTLRREAPMAVAAVVALAAASQGEFTRFEGAFLLVALISSIGWLVAVAEPDGDSLGSDVQEFVGAPTNARIEIQRVLVGLVGTLAGAQLLVWSATSLASDIGIRGGFVGFSIVAVGTSLPELVTSVMALRRQETALVIGNLLGSNLFNSLGVGGTIALIAPGPMQDMTLVHTGSLLMVIVAILAWVLMATGRRLVRSEGLLLIVTYLVCIVFVSA